ncbi:MAG: response regulator [Candidatus Wallbacteria bacterium]|nr:response regulator [Candidatus Wallbacteria bacterium]
MRALRVLVVEDNLLNRKLVGAILKRRGHEVLEACDLGEARETLGQGGVELVLLDIQVPGGGGELLLHEIRADTRWAGLPVVAVTSQAMAGDRERFLSAGFDGYFSKPIDTRTFAAEVEGFARQGEEGSPRTEEP